MNRRPPIAVTIGPVPAPINVASVRGELLIAVADSSIVRNLGGSPGTVSGYFAFIPKSTHGTGVDHSENDTGLCKNLQTGAMDFAI